MNIPVYNCLINENLDDESGIYAMSFVDAPANEVDFVALSKQPRREYLSTDTKKQILTGVVLRPNQLIYRNDPHLGEYYIRFSADQIEKIAHKMMRTGIALHNTTHQHQAPLKGNYMTELWIVENPEKDKSRALGFDKLPKGTLMCSYKIEDRNYWNNEVMRGNVKGFSLEGLFFQQTATNKQNKPLNKALTKNMNMNYRNKKSYNMFSKLAQFFLDIQAVEKADATTSGTTYVIFTLADGSEVYVDSEGFATIDGEQLPAGDHPLADGNTMTVDDQGQFIETKEASDKTNKPEEATAPQTLAQKSKKAGKAAANNPQGKAAAKDNEVAPTGNESIDALKAKIADLESKLSELANIAKEANTEVQKLRRTTPSALPLSSMVGSRRLSDMKRYEKMAQTLAMTIKNRR